MQRQNNSEFEATMMMMMNFMLKRSSVLNFLVLPVAATSRIKGA